MTEIPRELNWVEKRAACSVITVFKELLYGIENDVDTVNRVRQVPEILRFAADMNTSGSSVAIGQRGPFRSGRVVIGPIGERLVVRDEKNQRQWSASVGLNAEGRCVLKLEDGTELEQWQFRKKALEDLLFGELSG
jgi:hypothetical protein